MSLFLVLEPLHFSSLHFNVLLEIVVGLYVKHLTELQQLLGRQQPVISGVEVKEGEQSHHWVLDASLLFFLDSVYLFAFAAVV